MRKNYLLFLLAIVFCLGLFLRLRTKAKPTSAIAFELNRGRLGDCLKNYCKAKWIAYKHGLPLYVPYFPYAELFSFNHYDTVLAGGKMPFSGFVDKIEDDGYIRPDTKTLYISNYYFRSSSWEDEEFDTTFRKDRRFLRLIRKMLAPIEPVVTLTLPKDKVTIAVHVRKGGGFDPPLKTESAPDAESGKESFSDVKFPTKFPPEQFYIDQLKKIIAMYQNKPLYVYIFTDDKNPEKIAQRFEQVINSPLVTFDYRKKGNSYDANILEDLFSMAKFDCLIRPDSSFSLIADLLGDHKLVLWARHATWKDDKLIIGDVGMRRA